MSDLTRERLMCLGCSSNFIGVVYALQAKPTKKLNIIFCVLNLIDIFLLPFGMVFLLWVVHGLESFRGDFLVWTWNFLLVLKQIFREFSGKTHENSDFFENFLSWNFYTFARKTFHSSKIFQNHKLKKNYIF